MILHFPFPLFSDALLVCLMAWRFCLQHKRALWHTHVNCGSLPCALPCGDPLYHMLESPWNWAGVDRRPHSRAMAARRVSAEETCWRSW